MVLNIIESTFVSRLREGYNVEVKQLSQAKRIASSKRSFVGTTLSVWDGGILLAYKEGRNKWEHTKEGGELY